MRLSVQISKSTAQLPLPATAFLSDLRDTEFNSAALGLRHPIGIYNVSLTSVVNSFASALDAVDVHLKIAYDSDERKDSSAHLIQSLDQLLDAVVEHFADVRSIVRVFFDGAGERAWRSALRQFDETVRSARDFSAVQVNQIKHSQARVRLIHVTSWSIPTAGYFIEGVDGNGALGPNPVVHHGNTAYSFARAFRTLLCSVYFLARALPHALHRKADSSNSAHETGFGQLFSLFERMASYDRHVFWDEISNCPDIIDRPTAIVVDTQASGHWLLPPATGKIELEFGGDGVTRNFRMPYMGDYLNQNKSKRTRKV